MGIWIKEINHNMTMEGHHMNKPIPKSLSLFLKEEGGIHSEARIWTTVRQLESEGNNLKNIIIALFKVATARALEDSVGEYAEILRYAKSEAEEMLPKIEKIVNEDFEKKANH